MLLVEHLQSSQEFKTTIDKNKDLVHLANFSLEFFELKLKIIPTIPNSENASIFSSGTHILIVNNICIDNNLIVDR